MVVTVFYCVLVAELFQQISGIKSSHCFQKFYLKSFTEFCCQPRHESTGKGRANKAQKLQIDL